MSLSEQTEKELAQQEAAATMKRNHAEKVSRAKILVSTRSDAERQDIANMVKADRREKHLRNYPMLAKQHGRYC